MARPAAPTLDGPRLLRASAQQKEGDTHVWGTTSDPAAPCMPWRPNRMRAGPQSST